MYFFQFWRLEPKVKVRPGRFHPEVSSCRWLLSHCVPPQPFLGVGMCVCVGGWSGEGEREREGGGSLPLSIGTGPRLQLQSSPKDHVPKYSHTGVRAQHMTFRAQFSLLQSEGQRKGKVRGREGQRERRGLEWGRKAEPAALGGGQNPWVSASFDAPFTEILRRPLLPASSYVFTPKGAGTGSRSAAFREPPPPFLTQWHSRLRWALTGSLPF